MEKEILYLKKYLKNDTLEKGILKLKKGIPVQYIVGNVDFYGINILVNKNVLIPRFETEELVSKTINYVKKHFNKNIRIVDLGTGSGCIAIALKKKLENVIIDAVDISSPALNIAKKNALLNNVDINFYLGDLLSPLKEKYDVIISNPPYISFEGEIMEIVKNNEPNIALFANNHGLEFYERILKEASFYLKEKSIIALEIGSNQGLDVKKIACNFFPSAIIFVEKDMSDNDRFVFIFNNIVINELKI